MNNLMNSMITGNHQDMSNQSVSTPWGKGGESGGKGGFKGGGKGGKGGEGEDGAGTTGKAKSLKKWYHSMGEYFEDPRRHFKLIESLRRDMVWEGGEEDGTGTGTGTGTVGGK